MRHAVAARLIAASLATSLVACPVVAAAQSCPEPLASARRLVLVTADTMNTPTARLEQFERAGPREPWHALGGPQSALIGKRGMAWSPAFRALAGKREPIKVDGDKRAPAGIYRIGSSFGFAAARTPDYIRVGEGTVCVDDPSSAAYNTITTRARVGWTVHGENMWRVPAYRHGLVVDYPTDAKARAGSCIFIHIRTAKATGTSGCVAVPERQVIALQNFARGGAAIAILPRTARKRLGACLPRQTWRY
jgi:D-alanyl-D-alanine dipeptidase